MAHDLQKTGGSDLHFLLGYLNAMVGDWKQALSYFEPMKETYYAVLADSEIVANPLVRDADLPRSWSWCLIQAGRLDDAADLAEYASRYVVRDSDFALLEARLYEARGDTSACLAILQANLSESNEWDVATRIFYHLVLSGQFEEAEKHLRRIQPDKAVLFSLTDKFPTWLLEQAAVNGKGAISIGCGMMRVIKLASHSSQFVEASIAVLEEAGPAIANKFLGLAKAAKPSRASEFQERFDQLSAYVQRKKQS